MAPDQRRLQPYASSYAAKVTFFYRVRVAHGLICSAHGSSGARRAHEKRGPVSPLTNHPLVKCTTGTEKDGEYR